MKLVTKKISIKKDTLKDIESNNIDTELFIQRIKEHLEKANGLIDKKLIDLTPEEFYKSISDVFDIYFEPKDYLKILSLINNKHYNKFIDINTNMYDENNNNVFYLAAVSNKTDCQDNDTLSLDTIRKLTSSDDLVLLKQGFIKKNAPINKEKYEDYLIKNININSGIITEESELFPYAAKVFKKEAVIKDILYSLKLYVDEVLHQVRKITSLALVEDNDVIANIGKKYKKAYDKATNDNLIPKKEKISVRYHKKVKNKK